MKPFIPIIMMILFIGVSAQATANNDAVTGSKDLENQLKATLESYIEAFNSRDLDTVVEIEGDSFGYGWRSEGQWKLALYHRDIQHSE